MMQQNVFRRVEMRVTCWLPPCLEQRTALHPSFLGGQVARLTALCALYCTHPAEKGVDMPSYRTDTLKQKLVERFGDKLSFVNTKPAMSPRWCLLMFPKVTL